MGSQPESELPILDFSNENLKPGTDLWLSVCQVVRSALEKHGCFLALYDKISPELYDSIFSVMEELFDLPLETKRQKTSDKPHHGYSGQNPLVPLFESFAFDNPLSLEDCQNFSHIVWPAGNDHLSESVNAYAKLVVELDRMVKRMVFDSYGLENQKCESFLESNNYVLRSYKYGVPQQKESNMGVNSHTDTTFITILNQKVSGLEIKSKDGKWIDIDASPSLFLVMAGDAFKVWSNDRMQACNHRVVLKSKTERYSMGLLSYGGKMVQPAEELIDDQYPLRYKPFDHFGYLRFFLTEEALKSDCRIKAYCGI